MNNQQASTQAEKAVIESCIRDMENICQAIQGIYPAINSNIPTSRFTNSEKEACNFIEAIQAAFVSAGNAIEHHVINFENGMERAMEAVCGVYTEIVGIEVQERKEVKHV